MEGVRVHSLLDSDGNWKADEATATKVPKASKLGCPPLGSFMVNVDALICAEINSCSLRVIVRDCRRALVVVETKFLPSSFSISLAEALAVRLGLELAQRWHMS
uniref:RNase H type-1 domain-containing protein n=1 Tax=Cannabis sativa TaxID=3483 RepID=A0A803PGX5_CANSA